ncbi:MAG: NAD(P)H-dependent oxidoreductase [Patescibacteria group bacterium]
MFDDVNFFQHYVNDAQHIVFVYPTWWYNMPSILK